MSNFSGCYNPKSDLAHMPLEWLGQFQNGLCTDPCDMLSGPCACGATHHQYEWPDDVQMAVFGSIKVDEDWDRFFGRRKRRAGVGFQVGGGSLERREDE